MQMRVNYQSKNMKKATGCHSSMLNWHTESIKDYQYYKSQRLSSKLRKLLKIYQKPSSLYHKLCIMSKQSMNMTEIVVSKRLSICYADKWAAFILDSC